MGTHFNRGNALFELGRYREATKEFTQELADEPQSALALAMRAASLLNCGYTRSAEDDVRSAIALEPEWSYNFYVLSAIKIKRGRMAAAENAILEAIRIEAHPDYFCQLAAILYDTRRFNDCLKMTQRALELSPNDERSLILRARALTALGRNDEAESLLYSALAHRPVSPIAHHAMGQWALHAGQPQESLAFLQEARRLDPVAHNDWDSIAFAYGRQLFPFWLIDSFVPRWYLWPPWARWVLFALVGTTAFGLSLAFLHTSREAIDLVFLVYLAVVNICIFSRTYRDIVSSAGKCAVTGHVGEVFACIWRVVFTLHLPLTVVFIMIAILPPLPFFVYLAISYWGFFSDMLHAASLPRILGYLAIAIVLFVPAIAGAFASFHNPALAIAMWVTLVFQSFFSMDIREWIMRPRMLKFHLVRNSP